MDNLTFFSGSDLTLESKLNYKYFFWNLRKTNIFEQLTFLRIKSFKNGFEKYPPNF